MALKPSLLGSSDAKKKGGSPLQDISMVLRVISSTSLPLSWVWANMGIIYLAVASAQEIPVGTFNIVD